MKMITKVTALALLLANSAYATRADLTMGKDNWLFFNEEFQKPYWWSSSSATEIPAYMADMNKMLQQVGIKFAVIVPPRKVDIYSEAVSDPRITRKILNNYEDIINNLRNKGITTVDLKKILSKNKSVESLYLHNDTHWSPTGADIAAQEVSRQLQPLFSSFPTVKFTKNIGASYEDHGDIDQWLTDEEKKKQVQLKVKNFDFTRPESGDLLGDDIPDIVLAGTSYSTGVADRNSFYNSLEYYTQHDILNVSKPALGQWRPLRDYFSSPEYQNHAPKLLLWEVPARYVELFGPNDVKDSNWKNANFVSDVSSPNVKCIPLAQKIALNTAVDLPKKNWYGFIRIDHISASGKISVTLGERSRESNVVENGVINVINDFSVKKAQITTSKGLLGNVSYCELPIAARALLTNWDKIDLLTGKNITRTDLDGFTYYDQWFKHGIGEEFGLGPKSTLQFWAEGGNAYINISLATHLNIEKQSVQIFVNGQSVPVKSSTFPVKVSIPVKLKEGVNDITLRYREWNHREKDKSLIPEPQDIALTIKTLSITKVK